MYCLKCGKEIADDAIECPYCNCPTENSDVNLEEVTSQKPNMKELKGRLLATVSLVLGILNLVCAWLVAILGYIYGLIGIVCALLAKSEMKKHGVTDKRVLKSTNIGLITSIISFLFAVINSIIGISIMS